MTSDIFVALPGMDSISDASGAFPLEKPSSFIEEEQRLLLERCRLVFGLGLAISVVLIGFSRLVVGGEWGPIERWLDMAHIASFAIGFGALHFLKHRLRGLQLLALAVIAFNALAAAYSIGVVQTDADYDVAVVLALVLFVPAAVIPWRVRHQVALGVVALLAVGAAALTRYFQQIGAGRVVDPAFWDQVLLSAVAVTILAATSVLVTYTLYNLRRRAHRARRLGNYTIESELGKGGMGEVFVARHARMVRPSAVKVLRVSSAFDEESLARFEREVQTASSLTHPNTITIYDYGRADRHTFYYAMEYLEGMDLKRLVERFGPIVSARAVYIISQVCASLSEAHVRNVIHRDLKPANIFLTQRGGLFDYVKVLDFGLAKQVESDQTVTQTGLLVGTPQYMSPEAILGEPAVDTRSDIYSLGSVAYYLLTGRPPFEARTTMRLLYDHLQKKPEPPSRLAEVSIPDALDQAVMKCLEKDPDDRFQTVADLGATLADISFDDFWSVEKAEEWWRLHDEAMRPVLYESAPRDAPVASS